LSCNPTKTTKDAYNVFLRAALAELGYHNGGTVFEPGRRLKVVCHLYLHDVRKDVNNMLNFFLDIMQKVVYDNARAV
jgi:hypothetical protein